MSVDPTISEEHLNTDAIMAEPGLNPAVAATTVSGTGNGNEVDGGPEDAPDGSKFVERPMYNALDGTRGRAGGVYLDMVERANAETLRAKQEGREPDYNNPPAVAGTVLVPDAMRVDNPYTNTSSVPVDPVKEVDPVSNAPVDVGIATGATDTASLEQELAEAQARDSAGQADANAVTAEQGATPSEPADLSGSSTTTTTPTTTSSSGSFSTPTSTNNA